MPRTQVKRKRRDDLILIRVSPEEKRRLRSAAADSGLNVSAWLRVLGLAAARGATVGLMAALVSKPSTKGSEGS